jgi:hypothetical protein
MRFWFCGSNAKAQTRRLGIWRQAGRNAPKSFRHPRAVSSAANFERAAAIISLGLRGLRESKRNRPSATAAAPLPFFAASRVRKNSVCADVNVIRALRINFDSANRRDRLDARFLFPGFFRRRGN